jgi:MFS family permease
VEPSVLVNELMADFKITSSVVGFVISVMYIPYVALQIPCGLLTDKLGVKMIILISSAICSVGTFIFAAASNIFHLELGRFLIGLASASAYLCCGKIASDYFDQKRFSLLMGIAMFIGCFGGIVGTAPIAALVKQIGWRNTTYVISGVGILLLILTSIFVKRATPVAQNSTEKFELIHGIKALVKNGKTWLLGLYGALSYLPMSLIAELWGVSFAAKRYDLESREAAISSIIIFIGFGLGSIAIAWIAEKINNYKKIIIVSAVLTVLSLGVAIYSDTISYISYLSLMFFAGFFASSSILCFALVYELVPKKFSGTSTGFMNAVIMSSGLVFQPLFGKLLDFFRNDSVTDSGAPLYDITMYRSTFIFIIIFMILAVVAAFFINDTKRKEA